MKRVSAFFFVYAMFAVACGVPSNSNTAPPRVDPTTSQPGYVNGVKITASMSDAEILKAFGMETGKAQSKRAQGPDGYSMTYVQGDQTVGITRSVVTGVYVYSTGPIKGEWRLGKE